MENAPQLAQARKGNRFAGRFNSIRSCRWQFSFLAGGPPLLLPSTFAPTAGQARSTGQVPGKGTPREHYGSPRRRLRLAGMN